MEIYNIIGLSHFLRTDFNKRCSLKHLYYVTFENDIKIYYSQYDNYMKNYEFSIQTIVLVGSSREFKSLNYQKLLFNFK